MPYICDMCEGQEDPRFVFLPLTGGDAIGVGENCAVTFLTGALATAADVDPEKLYDAVKRLHDKAHTQTPDGQPKPAARRRRAAPAAADTGPGGPPQTESVTP